MRTQRILSGESMTDGEAITLANALALYAVDSLKEGLTLAEVEQLTVLELLNDIVDSLPREMESQIDDIVFEMIGGVD